MEYKDIRILLVDDEEDILEIVGYNLEQEGFEVLTAKNGKQAIKIAKKAQPQLIIMDVMMPEIDGIEACERIRAIPELSQTIITFLTARGEDYSQLAGFEAGADDYITKPIKPKLLISKIKALLRRLPSYERNNEDILYFNNLIISLIKKTETKTRIFVSVFYGLRFIFYTAGNRFIYAFIQILGRVIHRYINDFIITEVFIDFVHCAFTVFSCFAFF